MRYFKAFMMMVGFLVEVAVSREGRNALPASSTPRFDSNPSMTEG